MARKKYKVPDEQLSMFTFDTPSMPVLDVARCEARLINHETAARMVETYHYAHRVPSIVVAIGMYVDGVLAGVCTYGIPPSPDLCAAFGEENKEKVIELNRLFLFDWAGKNGESWLIGQSFKLIPNPYCILVSYADPDYNHIGAIYQATNWFYTGTSDSRRGEAIYNGVSMHTKTLRDLLGTTSPKNNSSIVIIPPSKKHRYVYFLGSKSQRKELRKALKWPVLPYPKRDK